jgi:hypothetical protein
MEFILRIRYVTLDGSDKLLKDQLAQKQYDATLIFERKVEKEKEVFYRIKMKTPALLKLKKFLDSREQYQTIELFEYREW